MRTIGELISHLRDLDIRLFVDGDVLGYNAPEGALTPELRREIVDNRKEIIELLRKVELSSQANFLSIPRVPRDIELPLSFPQQRLWFLDKLTPNSSTYNIPTATRLIGPLNVSAFKGTIAKIAQRHEVLRTSFVSKNGNPVQVISEHFDITLPVVDLQELSKAEQEAETRKLVNMESAQPFDLSQSPLFRVKLLRLSKNEHVFLLTMHHTVSDGWSIGIFRDELSSLYEAYSTGKPASLPKLPIQYADYAVWQREQLAGKAMEAQILYWRNRLSGAPHALELPPDRPRPSIQTDRGDERSTRISEELTESLKSLSHREGASLFMTMLAAFKVLLYRHTGQDDILIGSPIANRNRIEIENLIGFFVNTLVIRNDLSGDPGFIELLSRVRDACLETYAHQNMPFEKLVAELQPERDLSRTPLFQVWVNMMGFGRGSFRLHDLKTQPVSAGDNITSKFDLTLYITERRKDLYLSFVYNADLFDGDRMAEMLEQFKSLMAQIVDNPEAKISSYSLVTTNARKILPDPTHPFILEPGETMHGQFSQQASRTPRRAAIEDTNGTWKYSELESRSNQLANYLCSSGILPQDVVAIYAHRSANLVCAILGILKVGAAFIILDTAHPASRLRDYLIAVKPRGLIQLEEAGRLPEDLRRFVAEASYCCQLKLPRRWDRRSPLRKYSADSPNVAVNPDSPAYMVFTSGSTGKPRCILGTHRPVSHFLRWHCQTFGFNESDRFSMLSGLSHDPLLRDIFTPLSVGATLAIPQQETIEMPGKLADWMEQEKITVAHLTPAMSQVLTEVESESIEGKCPDLRYAFFGGDVLTEYHLSRIRRLAPSTSCVNFYGTTETPQAVGYYPVNIPDEGFQKGETLMKRQKMPLGRGIDGVQLLVLNDSGKLAGIREVGEICVRSPYLTRGYVGDEELTQEKFIVNPFTGDSGDRIYKTGDMGCYLSDGNVEFLGRMDNQVKIRDYRIEPAETETILGQYPELRQSVVCVRENSRGEKHLTAYIVLDGENVVKISELRRFLMQKLPKYMIPSFFVPVDSIPLTANGKVDYGALPEPDVVKADAAEVFIAPRDELESKLAEIWKSVLRIDSVGVRDNFFDLGGHSLLALSLFSQIQKVFGRSLPLTTLFQTPTIEQLADLLRR